MIFVMLVPYLIPESVRWLLSKGKGEKSAKIIKKIAKMNKRTIPDCIIHAVNNIKSASQKRSTSYFSLFSTSAMTKTTILVTLLWMLTSLVFDASIRNVSNMSLPIYTSFMLSAALEFPADLLAIIGLNYIGRRWSCFFCLLLCGLATLPAAWLRGDATSQT